MINLIDALLLCNGVSFTSYTRLVCTRIYKIMS